jgi:recombination protein RecT
MSTTTIEKPSAPVVAQTEKTVSQSFVEKVQRQFSAMMGDSIAWTDVQRALAQNLYVKADASLAALEVKRSSSDKNGVPITWDNVNMTKFCLDACRRIVLGLDALMPNHIHIVPYLNSRTQKYDVDIRIGYEGELDWRTRFAASKIKRVKIELVHDTDQFAIGMTPDGGEWAQISKGNPFDPGAVVGGYGWIMYEDPAKNFVHIVEAREFIKAQRAAKSNDFWGAGPDDKFRKEMQYKTVVFRVAKKIPIDVAKLNSPALKDAVNDAIAASIDSIDAEISTAMAAVAGSEPLSIPASLSEPAPAVTATVRTPEPTKVEADF